MRGVVAAQLFQRLVVVDTEAHSGVKRGARQAAGLTRHSAHWRGTPPVQGDSAAAGAFWRRQCAMLLLAILLPYPTSQSDEILCFQVFIWDRVCGPVPGRRAPRTSLVVTTNANTLAGRNAFLAAGTTQSLFNWNAANNFIVGADNAYASLRLVGAQSEIVV